DRPPLLDLADRIEELRRFHFAYGTVAERREYVLFETLDHVASVMRRPFRLHVFVPFARDLFEGVGGGELALADALAFPLSGVDPVVQKSARLQSVFTRPGQSDDRIDAQRQALFLAVEAILQTPIARAVRGDFDIKPVAVREAIGLWTGLGHSYRSFG